MCCSVGCLLSLPVNGNIFRMKNAIVPANGIAWVRPKRVSLELLPWATEKAGVCDIGQVVSERGWKFFKDSRDPASGRARHIQCRFPGRTQPKRWGLNVHIPPPPGVTGRNPSPQCDGGGRGGAIGRW